MAIPAVIFLYPDNTQVIQVQGLSDITTGLFLNSANVSATLIDQRGNADEVLNNLTLNYVATSNGDYQGFVNSTFAPNLGGGYQLQITAVQASVQSVFTIPVIVKYRAQI